MGMIDICQNLSNLGAENVMCMPDPEIVYVFAEHFQEESCLLPQGGTFLVD